MSADQNRFVIAIFIVPIRPRTKFIQRDRAQRLADEPERNCARRFQVTMFPLDLLAQGVWITRRIIVAARVEERQVRCRLNARPKRFANRERPRRCQFRPPETGCFREQSGGTNFGRAEEFHDQGRGLSFEAAASSREPYEFAICWTDTPVDGTL